MKRLLDRTSRIWVITDGKTVRGYGDSAQAAWRAAIIAGDYDRDTSIAPDGRWASVYEDNLKRQGFKARRAYICLENP